MTFSKEQRPKTLRLILAFILTAACFYILYTFMM